MASTSPRYQAVLDFWFGSSNTSTYGKTKPFWWSSTPALDQRIRENFEDDYRKARNGEYDDWKTAGPYQSLALILLMDQIPRNIFRNSPETYATDLKALAVAKYAVGSGFDKQLRLPVERKFMYMPFAHSEDIESQTKSLELFGSLEQYFGHDIWARGYYETVSRFGRFPHRNALLGRESTSEEMQYMKTNFH